MGKETQNQLGSNVPWKRQENLCKMLSISKQDSIKSILKVKLYVLASSWLGIESATSKRTRPCYC